MEIHRSAFKHGVTADEIEHAVDNAVAIFDLDPDSDPPKVLVVGPDLAGRWLEIIWLQLAEDDLVIHAMNLRSVFERLLENENDE